jgi:hypothetical protein
MPHPRNEVAFEPEQEGKDQCLQYVCVSFRLSHSAGVCEGKTNGDLFLKL